MTNDHLPSPPMRDDLDTLLALITEVAEALQRERLRQQGVAVELPWKMQGLAMWFAHALLLWSREQTSATR